MRRNTQADDRATMLPPIGARQNSTPSLLIVDDEPLLAEFLASIAEELGWTAELAITASEFEAKFDQLQPDALALDLAMPGRDGVELLRQLAANGFSGGLIIVSACDGPIVESSAMLAREHGLSVLGYLQKPVTISDFAALLEKAKPNSLGSALNRRH